MADTVHYHLERMLPELQDLEKRGLFSRDEIKQVVKRRRNFEYLLKRHSPLKQDFLAYVQYEQQLEALRKLRKRALVRGLKASGQRWRPSLSDRSAVLRIMLIYERAVTRFKADLRLWLRYLEFCREHGPRRLQKVITKALQLHSAVPGLWMYAAAWEFQHNLNVNAARVLMQRGLRMCPKSQSLWHEYFKMELTYSQKIEARRLVLGLPSTQADHSAEDSVAVVDANSTTESDLTYKIARTIFRNAIVAIPSDVAFRQRFLELLKEFDEQQAAMLQEEISRSLAKDFPTDEASWDWRARQCFSTSSKQGFEETLKGVLKVYEDAIRSVPSVRMYELFSQCLEDMVNHGDSGPASDSGSHATGAAGKAYEIAHAQLQLYQRAQQRGLQSEVLAHGHLSLLLRWGKIEEARTLAAQFCAGSCAKSAKLWHLRLSLELKMADMDRTEVKNLFHHALKVVPLANAKPVWQMAMEFFSRQDNQFTTLLDLLETALAGGVSRDAGADMACVLIDWILNCQGIERARQAYNRLLALPGPSIQFLRHCIAVEARTAAIGDEDASQQVRSLFDIATTLHGHEDGELWLEYCNYESQAGNTEGAGAVYWRAKKVLRDPGAFVEAHAKLSLCTV